MESIRFIIQMMQQSAGKTSKDLADHLKVSTSAYTQYLNGSFAALIRFIRIAKFCGYDINISNKDKGININLSEMVFKETNKE